MHLKTWTIALALVAVVGFIATPADGQRRGEPIQEEPESEAVEDGKIKSRWFGTAPLCGATAEDCAQHGLQFWLYNNFGDGAGCAIGNKVLCVHVPKSDFGTTYWVGTAPYCNAKPEDCAEDGATFIAYGKAGDGHTCTKIFNLTGFKVLCAHPKAE